MACWNDEEACSYCECVVEETGVAAEYRRVIYGMKNQMRRKGAQREREA